MRNLYELEMELCMAAVFVGAEGLQSLIGYVFGTKVPCSDDFATPSNCHLWVLEAPR